MRRRRGTWVALVAAVLAVGVVAAATGAGPGGWDHAGTGTAPTFPALNGTVNALSGEAPGGLIVAGAFTNAGGVAAADYIARWDGAGWHELGSATLTGAVNAVAYRGGKIYVGGLFRDAGGDPNADYAAVWDGGRWRPACTGTPIGDPVYALAVVGSTLYVGGTFRDAAGIADADSLVACDANTGAPRSAVGAGGAIIGGGVYALTGDSRGRLYAGGAFTQVAGNPATNKVAYLDAAGWHGLGTGPGPGGTAVDRLVRSLAASGTDVYLGTDAVNIGGLPQADHVARWNGSAWSALGSNAAGADGWFPATALIYAFATAGLRVFVGGAWTDAGGDPLADRIAQFDGGAWQPVGSNGAGDGPFNGAVNALATVGSRLYAGGPFSNGGGDPLARFLASYPLAGAPVFSTPSTPTTTPTGTASGAVTVNGRSFTTGAVPFGATVDVTRGSLVLQTSSGRLRVYGAGGVTAKFKLVRGAGKVAGKPVTELRLTGGTFSACPNRKTRSAAATAPAKKPIRQLWGSGKGSFRTRGRNAAATVRGTVWLTADRCDGTFVRVRSGTVEVLDPPKRRPVTVRAGKPYLARP